MINMKKIIIGLGEILWDVFPERKILGGAPANFAYYVSQFGFNGYVISAVGDDILGKNILNSLEEKSLNYLIETTSFPTGIVQVTLSGEGIPNYEICENVAWDNIPFTEHTQKLANKASAVCFGSLAQRSKTSRETIRKFLLATPPDCLRVCDINLRQHFYDQNVIEESLEICNVLKMNEDELEILADMIKLDVINDIEFCKQLLKKFHLEIIILTKGTEGSYIFTKNDMSFQSTPKVQVADTVGAGDSFTAAFVSAFLSDKSIKESHRIAVEVSAFVCQKYGGMSELNPSITRLIK